MSNIPNPIGQREWELIRDRIGLILANELLTQSQIDYDDQLFELPDVYIERFKPFNHTEMPCVNVMLAQGDYTQETQQTQDGTWTFYVDGYTNSKSSDGQRGDQYAAIRLHRLMGIMQAIIMDSRHKTLLFEAGSISNRSVKSIRMADPTKAMEATNSIMARMTIEVRCSDNVELLDAIDLSEYVTQLKLGSTALGYFWGGTTSFTPPTTCSDAELNVNGVFLANIPSGEEFNLVVIDTAGNVVGDPYGNTIIVPTAELLPASVTLNAIPLSDVAAGSSKAIVLTYANGDPLDVTIDTDTPTSATGTVPDPEVPTSSGGIYKTGADVSYFTGDDADVKRGAGADWFLLGYDNPFGNQLKMTGVNGGGYNGTSYVDVNGNPSDKATEYPNDILVDWSKYNQATQTVTGLWFNPLAADSLNDHLLNSPYSNGGYADWVVWNIDEMFLFCKKDFNTNGWLNYAPVSYVYSGSSDRIWCTTGTVQNPNYYFYLAGDFLSRTLYTLAYQTFTVRQFTLTELGL